MSCTSSPTEAGAKARILILEDEDTLRNIIVEVLHEAGYEVVAVGSGMEALSKASESDFDLLISDILTPDIDGYNVVRAFRDIGKPSLVMSGRALGDMQKEMAQQRIPPERFLSKPFTNRALLQKVRAVLDGLI